MPQVLDTKALEAALRSLGMYYGTSQPLEVTMAGAPDEAAAIRAYLQLERPHLLAVYDIDTLVKMIQDARAANRGGSPGMEQFSPR